MRKLPTEMMRVAVLLALCYSLVATTSGCAVARTTSESSEIGLMLPPARGEMAADAGLDSIRSAIIANSRNIVTLVADCQVHIRNRTMEPSSIVLEGQLVMRKPGQIRLDLRRTGSISLRLIGDGRSYRVEQPMFGNVSYSGEYGKDVEPNRGRITFLPEDLVETIDMSRIFAGASQVMRAYPRMWDVELRDQRNPRVARNRLRIDSLIALPALNERGQLIYVDGQLMLQDGKLLNSLVLDPRTKRVQVFERFRFDGSLASRVWILRWAVVSAPDMRRDAQPGAMVSCEVPELFIINYPTPLEGTAIGVRLSNIHVNVPVEDDARFRVVR